jgi:UDP-N-acetylglucosamine--N-acetylmuramyl-(pentapeptide) pyrophosphoryl-undecaprenol N-acetylglucosamine transferase
MENKTIFLVGGGTGGHVLPIYFLYNRLIKKYANLNIITVGTGGEIENEYYASMNKYEILKTGKFIRSFDLRNFNQFFLIISGFINSYLLLKKYKPDMIFSKGGYGSLPLLKVAKLFNIPFFIHESDIEMGLANKIASKNAEKVFVGFPIDFYKNVDQNKMIYSGQMIENDVFKTNKKYFNNSDPIIFITGGSQGSKSINQRVFKSLEKLLKKYNVIHQVGFSNKEEAEKIVDELPEGLSKRYKLFGLMSDQEMRGSIASAQLIISRAGATTIAEIAGARKPAILIPYKYAASDHQTKNIEFLLAHQAIISISDDELKSEKLINEIEKAIEDKHLLNELSSNLNKTIKIDGVKVVEKEIKIFLERK